MKKLFNLLVSVLIFSFPFIFSTKVYSALTSEYFPLAVGNIWKFKNTLTGEIAISQITDSKIMNGKKTYILVTSYSNCKDCGNIAYFVKTDTNLLITYSVEGVEDLFLRFSSETGDNWEILSKQGKITKTEVVNKETVSVPAGTFTAYKVKTSVKIKDSKETLVIFYNWYAENVGWIKGQKEGKETWELIEYQVK